MQFALPVLAAAGPIVQGIAGSKAAQYNARVNEANARSSLIDANQQASRIRMAGRIELGKQFLAQAESGFEVGTGSALTSLLESATNNEMEAMDALHEGLTRGYAYNEEARMQRQQGKFSLIEGFLSGASAAIGAASNYASAGAG